MKPILLPTLTVATLLAACNQKPEGQSTPVSVCGSPNSALALKVMDTTVQIAPLLTNLGDYGFAITTPSPQAQSFFNQGLNLYYGFNHLEAFRSFREAARLDPSCAMCWWGQALSLGPNINAPMDPSDAGLVFKAVRRAQSSASGITDLEMGLIEAIAKRYSAEALNDRAPLDLAYAEAMRQLALKFPDSDEVVTLCAEALMDLHPWDYWLRNGDPQPWTPEILSHVDRIMARSPRHPGANHLHIHLREASSRPDKAMASADLLRDLVPGSGHLVHMPSHIYIRTGRYADGILANQKAVKADEDYVTTCRAQGIYPLAYYPHNYHFYWACAQMSGRKTMALDVARTLVSKIAIDLMGTPDLLTIQHYYVTPWYSMVRFAQWEEIRKEAPPADSLRYALGIWNYVRGMAALKTEGAAAARPYLDELKSIGSDPALKDQKIWGINSFGQVLGIAAKVLEGELYAEQKKYTEAIEALESAIAEEDALLYQEPADWYYPVRENLGHVLLKAGKAAEAETRFNEDLNMYPENGWALAGLYKSLQAQGKKKEADAVKAKYEVAFAEAEVTALD
jgi:tetratricopeptide (TPR) repeat protein